jgi:hypothetical protein
MNELETGIGRRRSVLRDRCVRRAGMPAALLFRFPFSGPWGEELAQASQELASDIANEAGLVWKIWLEDRETGQAGGIYLFEDVAAASRYREKHEQRLAAMGLSGVMVDVFSVNTGLSVLTMARAALGVPSASEIPSMATITMRP